MLKVLFICAGGISTSFLEQNTQKAFTAKGIDVEIKARSATDLDNYIDDVDIVLLAPQVAYMKQDIMEMCEQHNKPLIEIPMATYGRMDGKKVRDMILEKLGQ
jgi:PTS system cellobiose-specific IIB component